MKKLFGFAFLITLSLSIASVLTSCGCSHLNREYYVKEEPTYVDSGALWARCLDCEDKDYFAFELYAFRDDMGYEVTVVTEPTCTTDGYSKYVYTFNEFSFEFESDVPAIPHTLDIFTANDTEWHKEACACGYSENKKHTFTDTVTNEPTCTEVGKTLRTCSLCAYELTCEIAKLPHTSGAVGRIEPTCTSLGYTAGEKCTVCGGVLSGVTEIPKNPHSYVSGTCENCPDRQRLTVTYVTDGGRESVECYYGDSFFEKELADSADNVFRGWYSEDGGTRYGADTVVFSDLTVYARFDTVIPVGTREEFLAIWDAPDKSYRLTAEINMRGEVLTPIPLFSGTLDGGGFAVKNFSVSTTELADNQGLIQVNEGVLKNLKIKDYIFNLNAEGANNGAAVGGLIGRNKGVLEEVGVEAVVNTSVHYDFGSDGFRINLGGIIGINDGTVKGLVASFTYNVSTATYNPIYGVAYPDRSIRYNVGKICAQNNGEMDGVLDNGSFTLSTELGLYWLAHVYVTTYLGGLIAENNGTVTRSYHVGDVQYIRDTEPGGYEHESAVVGGFVGVNLGHVAESYFEGEILGGCLTSYRVGGFVGLNDGEARISSCYADSIINSHVEGSNAVGGFAGINDALIQNCYSAGEIHSSVGSTLGGFVGINNSGGTVARSYSKTAVNAASYRSGIFAADNFAIITKSYYLTDAHFNMGDSVFGELSVTTDISEIDHATLVSEEFMSENLYWNEEGWTVSGTSDPTLTWTLTE